jgi:hypothetical protein
MHIFFEKLISVRSARVRCITMKKGGNETKSDSEVKQNDSETKMITRKDNIKRRHKSILKTDKNHIEKLCSMKIESRKG